MKLWVARDKDNSFCLKVRNYKEWRKDNEEV